jgi:hypothetical protein
MKMTKPQLAELKAQMDKGSQPTFGSGRARVQNKLVSLGLSVFSGNDAQPSMGRTYYSGLRCAITDRGRAVLLGSQTEMKLKEVSDDD